MVKYCLIVLVSIWCWVNIVVCDDVDTPISEDCLKCICETVSRCDTEVECVDEGKSCGRYMITKPQWEDSGKPTYNNYDPNKHESFVKCATNEYCSLITMQKYMKKYKTDCNNDGVINCDDFVKTHWFGDDQCEEHLPKKYQKRYNDCKRKYPKL